MTQDPHNVSDEQLAARYRRAYHVAPGIGASEARTHMAIEHALARRLLVSSPEDRWEVFAECYTTFYRSVTWLDRHLSQRPSAKTFKQWSKLIPAGSDIFEVGSGQAHLLRYLCAVGHQCVATEITPERGEKYLSEGEGLQWHTTDGIHLADFETKESYDVVISNQVIEHFHPDDLIEHLRHVLQILRPGGRYIFATPHKGAGPHDVSKLFGLESSQCFHLKEYDYIELCNDLAVVGFTNIRAVFPPTRLFKLIGFTFESSLYLRMLSSYDRLEKAMNLSRKVQRRLRHLLKYVGLTDCIWLVATCPR